MAKKTNTSTKHFEEQFGRRVPQKPFMPKGSENWQENAGFKKASNKGEGNYEEKKFRKPGEKPFGARPIKIDDPKKPFGRTYDSKYTGGGKTETSDKKFGDKKPFNREGSDGRKPFGDKKFSDKKPFNREGGDGRKPFGENKFGDKKFGDKKPYNREGSDGRKPFGENKFGDKIFGDKKPYNREGGDGRKPFGDKPFARKQSDGRIPFGESKPRERNFEGNDRKFADKNDTKPERKFDKGQSYDRNATDRKPKEKIEKPKKEFNKSSFAKDGVKKNDSHDFAIKKITIVDDIEVIDTYQDDYITHSHNKREQRGPKSLIEEQMPLNKYVSRCGICGRREAAVLIKDGRIKVNGATEINPAYRVEEKDVITYNDKKLTMQHNLVYVLLNKPKDFITTSEDPEGRKTVMDLVANAVDERIYPVGRLDRNTSGLLLLTNDGELAQKMSHPKYAIKKLYQVNLDKPLNKPDFDKILAGVTLEDGVANVDQLAFVDAADKTKIGIEIHSGRNRIVRRIFESQGYVVKQLDRVMYANLTKKNLPRGKWRFLNESEVRNLKHY
jgi:23S rRNA pseudouridine2605 synthase